MADQKFRGVAVCVVVIGGNDRRPSDPMVVFGVQVRKPSCLERPQTVVAARSEDERLGSGDGERKTLLTRQIAFEPLPASVLFVPDGRFRVLVSGEI